MSFDTSRFTFDSWRDFFGVVMQQGRVLLDSDWNELLDELARRIQAGTLDTLGRAVYPATTPYAFKINASMKGGANHLTIGAGRMYVDGLLAENHGPQGPAQFDEALAELSNTYPGAPEVDLDYTQQPYYPGAPAPRGKGDHLVYLDVWRRAITYIQEPDLVDQAVGVDTTGRLQTAWQVRLLDVSGVKGGVTCSTPDSDIPAWIALTQPSAGQLTTAPVSSAAPGPCCLTPNTGYTGLENQNYRVEIHRPGTPTATATGPIAYPIPAGTATFKWSRDNASVATAVTAIAAVTTGGAATSQLTVQSMGRDQVLGFSPGNWIEITDDYQELNGGQAGELHQIIGINAAARTITLDSPVTAASFPLTGGQTDPTRHTRIRRWDQTGKVYQSDGATVWVDLGSAGSTGEIPVPPPGTTLILENGIAVTFGLNTAFFPGGTFHVGDFWTVATRTADGWIEPLAQAPPRGIHHHYARLAVVKFPDVGHGPEPEAGAALGIPTTDCRVEWPPASGDCPCHCSVTVQPGDITPNNTLQNIIDKYKNLKTPTTICLMPGTYPLDNPLRCTSAHSNITLEAFREGTATLMARGGQEDNFSDGLVVLDDVGDFTLRGLVLAIPQATFAPTRFAGLPLADLAEEVRLVVKSLTVSIGVRPFGCRSLTIEDCRFELDSSPTDTGGGDRDDVLPRQPTLRFFSVGILAGGSCRGLRLEGNTFRGVGLDFTAGFVLAPSVSFTPPAASDPGRIRPQAPRATTQPAKASGAVLATRARPSAPQAANGGTVVPSTLTDALLKGNTFERTTIAALIVGECGAVEVVGNRVRDGSAGLWLLSPLQAVALLYDPQNVALYGLSLALGYPLPQGDTTPTVAVAAAPSSIRIYTGKADYTDKQSNVWVPDVSAKSVTINNGNLQQGLTPPGIADTDDPQLYMCERWGSPFGYTFTNLPPGYYQVTLKFAEIYETAAGRRIFDVSINGEQVLSNFDIFADVGGDTADDWTFGNIAPDQGQITLVFTGHADSPDIHAKINAVEVDPEWSGTLLDLASLQGGGLVAEFQTFLAQLIQLGQQGFAGLAASPLELRLTDNQFDGLSAAAIVVLGDDLVQNGKVSALMMTGNRLETTVAGLDPERVRAGGDLAKAIPLYLWFAMSVSLVTRCAISGNMILNDAYSGTGDLGYSLFLYDDSLSEYSRTTPPPEIAVMGNVFQGGILIIPERSSDPSLSTVPSPMNSWKFLNTVVP